jgi:hypothetical protein
MRNLSRALSLRVENNTISTRRSYNDTQLAPTHPISSRTSSYLQYTRPKSSAGTPGTAHSPKSQSPHSCCTYAGKSSSQPGCPGGSNCTLHYGPPRPASWCSTSSRTGRSIVVSRFQIQQPRCRLSLGGQVQEASTAGGGMRGTSWLRWMGARD